MVTFRPSLLVTFRAALFKVYFLSNAILSIGHRFQHLYALDGARFKYAKDLVWLAFTPRCMRESRRKIGLLLFSLNIYIYKYYKRTLGLKSTSDYLKI